MTDKKAKEVKLTPKQEKYCHNFILSGRKSASYRKAYECGNMKPETVNRKAFELHQNGNVRARIDFLQKEAARRNRMSRKKLIDMLSVMASFDPADSYNDDGTLAAVEDMPIANRLMLASLEVDEFVTKDLKINNNKKVKYLDRHVSIDKLLRIYGAYAKDNEQKKPTVNNSLINAKDLSTEALLEISKAYQKKKNDEDGGNTETEPAKQE